MSSEKNKRCERMFHAEIVERRLPHERPYHHKICWPTILKRSPQAVSCAKSPFALVVIADWIRNPAFSIQPKAGLDTPYLMGIGNDGFRNIAKKR